MKRRLSMFLTAAMLLTFFAGVSLTASAADEITLVAALDKPVITYSATEDQTVRLTVTTEEPVGTGLIGWSAVQGESKSRLASGSSPLVLTGIENEEHTFTTNHYALSTGMVSFMYDDLHDFETSTIGTLVVKVPAGTPAGEYIIGINKIVLGTKYATVVVLDGGEAYATLTIAEETANHSADYTVSLEASASSVNPGDSFTVDVDVSGAGYNGADIKVAYDTDLFTYDAWTGSASRVTEANGKITVGVWGSCSEGTLATLSFTAKSVAATTAGDFEITTAQVTTYDLALAGTYATVEIGEGVSVTVNAQIAVSFYEQGGSTLIDTCTVGSDGKLATVPTASAVTYYDFAGWSDGTNTYTAAELLARTFTANASFTAVYTPKTFTVTLGTGLTGADSATYGVDYVGVISGYDADDYMYSVTYIVGGKSLSATVNSNGTFTISGGDITGALSVSVTGTYIGFTVTVHEDYVAGYTLVLVDGDAANYSYDGSNMYYVERYEAFAYIVEGSITAADAKAKITISTGTAVTITDNYNVNGRNGVDLNDVVAVVGCYAAYYDVDQYMDMYLRADVDGSYTVDSADAALVWDNMD